MKTFVMAAILVLCFSLSVLAQSTALHVTTEDFQLQFVGDPTEQWRSVTNFSITYYAPPIEAVTHNPRGKLGPQRWHFGLKRDGVTTDGCVVTFDLLALVSPNLRSYIVRVRPRDEIMAGDWFIGEDVRIIGKIINLNHE